MSDKLKVFHLAHPTNSRHRVRAWELAIEKEYKMILNNPFYDETSVEQDDIHAMDKGAKSPPHDIDYDRQIYDGDLKLVEKADGLIGIIDGETSYGTLMEVQHAKSKKKPIYLIVTNGQHTHPFLRAVADKIFKTYSEFEEALYQGEII